MTHESTASIIRERKRRNRKKKKVWEKKGFKHTYQTGLLSHNGSIIISFRCSFRTWVYLACKLLLSCFLIFFFFFFWEKFLVVCFYKDGDFVFVLAYSFHFFFLFDEIIFISFRCSFSKWVHLAYWLLLLLLFFWRKFCWFVLVSNLSFGQ